MNERLDCATVPTPPAPTGATEAELAAAEGKARESLPKLREAAAAKRVADGLVKVRATLSKTRPDVSTCTKETFKSYVHEADGRLKVDTADYDYLDSPAAADGGTSRGGHWSWLTSDRLASIVDEARGTASDSTPALDLVKDGGPFVVVYRAETKDWPVVKPTGKWVGKKMAYESGEFDGWMIVANYETGDLVCMGKLSFTNGHDITYSDGAGSEQERAREAVEDDFKSQFEDAATDEVKAMTGDGVRLGYKILE
jgi:hypothetical protein